jgi:hypothetical protein
MLQGQTGPAPGAAGYWGRDAKNKRVWITSGTPGDAADPADALKLYVESDKQERERVQAHQRAEEQRARRAPYVNCFRNFTPRSDSAMTSRSKVSLASSIAFSNNPWEGKPKIGGAPVYMKVGSRSLKAPSFEPADCQYERTPPPEIPHTSTSQGTPPCAPPNACRRPVTLPVPSVVFVLEIVALATDAREACSNKTRPT